VGGGARPLRSRPREEPRARLPIAAYRDCAIKVRLRPENVPAHRPVRFRATLAGTRDLTHDLREFRFATRGAAGFLPGQYALFTLPGVTGLRTYSMSNVDDGTGNGISW
jgi:hypothetical protein